MTGRYFGRWVVIGAHPSRRGAHKAWECRCECGTVRHVQEASLKNKSSKSCGNAGCLGRRTNVKHGMHGSSEYGIWEGMIQRCTNPRCRTFALYGARGIRVVKKWLKFANFFADMGLRPSALHSLDRINNSRGYSKANCRWATASQQGNNTRRVIYVTRKGETKSVTQWCQQLALPRKAVYSRIKNGWPRRRWFEPVKTAPGYTFNGQQKTFNEWGRLLGVSGNTIAQRVAYGYPPEWVMVKGPVLRQVRTEFLRKKKNDITSS